MSNACRLPLATRPTQSLLPTPSPLRSLKPPQQPKRPRSPDSATHNLGSLIKRHKAIASTVNQSSRIDRRQRNSEALKSRERHKTEREQQRLEFKEKYRRAFPSWTFYLDTSSINDQRLELFQSRILKLGGKIDPFFQREVTHVISDKLFPSQIDTSEKENHTKSRPMAQSGQISRSPVKAVPRLQENPQEKDVVKDALAFGKKIWDSAKLESVLSRCLDDPGPAPSLNTSIKSRNIHNLSKLLQSERIYGLSERDPTQKRHDFRYFTRGSHFVLIEDIRGELATIAAHEYPVYKEREGRKTPWPTLHCHPQARGPFILFDEKEKKRWDRLQEAEKKETAERRARCEMFLQRQTTEKKTEPGLLARRAGDLRRSVSLNNMPNAAREELLVDHDADGDVEFISASGFLASGLIGYMAASGNSVSITSTIGTTSTANYAFRTQQMPSNLNGKIRQEIIMHRQPQDRLTMANKMANKMGPPVGVPQRHAVLKKSKSTTTIKLPKREEGSKPGYCESCRSKFNDFREHVQGYKHRKFAEDDRNFEQLDELLIHVQRRSLAGRQALDARRICHLHGSEPEFDVNSILN